jgi:hypothetical protein
VRHGCCPFRVVQPRTFGCRNLNLGAATWNLASFACDCSPEAPRHNQHRNKWHSVARDIRESSYSVAFYTSDAAAAGDALGAEGWRSQVSNRYQSYPSGRLAVLERLCRPVVVKVCGREDDLEFGLVLRMLQVCAEGGWLVSGSRRLVFNGIAERRRIAYCPIETEYGYLFCSPGVVTRTPRIG